MRNIKTYGLLLFLSPCILYFAIWVLFIVPLFKGQQDLFKEVSEIIKRDDFRDCNKRQKYLIDTCIDISVHSAFITWITVFIFLMP